MKPGRTGLSRIFHATLYSWAGLRAAWKHEAAFRQECTLALIMLPLAFWVGETTEQRVALIIVTVIVVIVEIINSAIEAVVDRISDERHPLAGRAKDLGSAAVFISLSLVVVVWGLMIYERFFA